MLYYVMCPDVALLLLFNPDDTMIIRVRGRRYYVCEKKVS